MRARELINSLIIILEDIRPLCYYRNNFKRDFDKKSKIYKILREEMAGENFQFYIFEN